MVLNRRRLIGLAVLLAIAAAGHFVRLPYFITGPGQAIELAGVVEVEDGDREEKGSFMLTTVGFDQANLWNYLYSLLHPRVEPVPAEEIIGPHENPEEYFAVQKIMMQDSQEKAIIAAYTHAGLKIGIENEGVWVTSLMKGMPAANVLKAGDIITEVDGKRIHTKEQLLLALKGRQPGEKVAMTVIREERPLKVTVAIAPFPNLDKRLPNAPKAGIGILDPFTKRKLILGKNVTIKTENIGGPSAGLMFALEIMNQLLPGDLTKGYKIAGTGTIDEKGSVGRVGGAHHKVVAAYRRGAEIFFAPDDGTSASNYEEARRTAEELRLPIKVVPVKSLRDALDYLGALPEKTGTGVTRKSVDKGLFSSL